VHCFNYWRTDNSELESLNQETDNVDYSKIVDKIIEQHPLKVIVTGGEPFLVFEKIKPGIERLILAGISVSINSNVALVTDDIAEFLKKHRISVFASYPCGDEKICDRITGIKGSFQRLSHGLSILQKNNVSFTPNMVVSKINIEYIESTVKQLVDRYHVKSISLTRVGKPVNSTNEFDRFLLDREDIKTLLSLSIKLQKMYSINIGASVPYPVCSLNTQEEYNTFAGKRACSAGKLSYVISSNGTVKACARDSESYGSILEEEFSVIWNRMGHWRDDTLIPEECSQCKTFTKCYGGCRVDMLPFTGKCNELDTIADLSKLPVTYKSTPKPIPSFDRNANFQVASGLKVQEENGFIRVAANEQPVYLTISAWTFLKENKNFSLNDFCEYFSMEEQTAEAVINRLKYNKVIHTCLGGEQD
jgi:radical SAM protein with 4Fe4S-binding SPASM domain